MTTDTTAAEAELPATALPPGMSTAEYRESLTQKADPTGRPDHVPEKFWDAEKGQARWDDLAKSYGELEKRFASDAAIKTEPEAEPTEKVNDLKITKPEADAANPLTTAFETFASKYDETSGQPGDEAIAEIEGLGVPRAIIDTYLAGLEALRERELSSAFAVAGGEDAFNSAMKWATANLSDEDVAGYNSLVANAATAKQGIEWLMSRYTASQPREGRRIQGEASAGIGEVFQTKQQMIEAMKSARYTTDSAFRQEVAEKAARSKQAGNW